MELTGFQRITTFAVVVIVLVGLGVYLFLPSAAGSGTSTPGPSASTPSGRASGLVPSSQPTAAASPPAGAVVPDIYQWLPFTQAGLASAAHVALAFGADYGTFSYSQGTAAYLAPMRSLVTSQLAALIGRAYASPGVAAARVSQQQVAAGKAAIVSLRGFGQSSLTFVVAVTEQITDSKGRSQQTTDYAVTLTGGGGSWQVNDIELATAGNL
jgi:hypothetical protein